ncbi:MAG: urease accessory protein UreF [Muribaculaceae bacterium]|nr:urease accessory protein UreF [Muribaculaceae bacterium]
MESVMRLLQMTDSTFPVGTFSFSNGLETAAYEKIVYDKETLREFAKSQARQAAFTDGVAAIAAYNQYKTGDIEKIIEIDEELIRSKMNDEARQMLQRMGKKMAELGLRLFPEDELISKWLEKIRGEETPGTYPVAQGIVFAAAGVGRKELFCSHQYGVVNMVLGAALRTVKVSHYDTQEILLELGEETECLYEEVLKLTPENMHAFFPQLDILASLHEKGAMRMFMN